MSVDQVPGYREVIIIGSGPSGLSTALRLREHGIEALLLERHGSIAGNWSNRIPDQYLTTPFSSLKLRKHDRHRKWITGKEYWLYLGKVAVESGLKFILNWEATSIGREGSKWVITSPRGVTSCSVLIIATGQHDKRRPPLQSDGSVPILHSSEFERTTQRFSKTLVVGLGTSGADIATLLAQNECNVSVAVRTIPVILPREILGVPVTKLGNVAHLSPAPIMDFIGKRISQHAFGALPWNVKLPRHRLSERYGYQYAPVIDDGFVEQVKRARIKIKPGFIKITNGYAIFEDGSTSKPALVIDATGYESSYQSLFCSIQETSLFPARTCRETKRKPPTTLFMVGLRPHLNVFADFVQSDSRHVAGKVAEQVKRKNI